jgi:23S rRNA pseudouridine955/2504/2580 synthase
VVEKLAVGWMVAGFDPFDMRLDCRMLLRDEFGELVLLFARAENKDRAGVSNRLGDGLEVLAVLRYPVSRALLATMDVADRVIRPDDSLVRLIDAEVENARLLVVDPNDRVKMMGHCDLLSRIRFSVADAKVVDLRHARTNFGAAAYRARRGRAMTRFMEKNGDGLAAVAAPDPDKAAVYEIGDDESGMRLDRWLHRRFPLISISHLMKIVRKGEVRVLGRRADVSTRLAAGESVRVPPLRPAAGQGPPASRTSPGDREAIQAMTLFEDRDVIVLNKPYGLAVQGGSGTKRHIDGMLEALADKHGDRPVLVHRLDRDTSGVLLIAKSRKIAADLGEIFRSRSARKIYWALVEGVPKPAQGRISMFLAKGEGMGDARGAGPGRAALERMRVASHGDKDAQHSLTLYAVVDKVAPRLAWLSMRPVTGRTHQLRAHCEAIGHPIIGDPKYNRRPASDPARNDPLRAVPPGLEPKLHLLARRLILPHPRGGIIDVTAPLPEHMKKSFAMFGFDERERDPIEDAPDE